MLALVLLAQMNTAPTPVSGQRTLADVARERALKRAGEPRPTAVVLELATPAPVPMSAAPRRTPLGPDFDQPTLPTTNSADFRATMAAQYTPAPDPTPIVAEKGAADRVAAFGDSVASAVGFTGLGFGVFAVLFIGLVWLCSPLLGIRIGRDKGFPDWAGLLAGLALGPFVLLMVFLTPSRKKCPFCTTAIPIEALVCPRCTREQPSPKTPRPRTGARR